MGSDLRPLLSDAAARPAHYTAATLDTLSRLQHGRPTTPAERLELLLQYTRRTEARAEERRIRATTTAEATKPPEEPPPFEDQAAFAKTLRII